MRTWSSGAFRRFQNRKLSSSSSSSAAAVRQMPTAATAQYTGGAPYTRPAVLAERMAAAGRIPVQTGLQSMPGLQAATQTQVESRLVTSRQLYDPETNLQLYTRGGDFEEWVLELGAKSRNQLCARVHLGKTEKAELVESARRHRHCKSQRRYAGKIKVLRSVSPPTQGCPALEPRLNMVGLQDTEVLPQLPQHYPRATGVLP